VTSQTRRSPIYSVILVLLALACLAGAVFYWTQRTSLLASGFGLHHKHAEVLGVLTLVFLAGAVLVRPRPVTG
jgi:hypothetical protein